MKRQLGREDAAFTDDENRAAFGATCGEQRSR